MQSRVPFQYFHYSFDWFDDGSSWLILNWRFWCRNWTFFLLNSTIHTYKHVYYIHWIFQIVPDFSNSIWIYLNDLWWSMAIQRSLYICSSKITRHTLNCISRCQLNMNMPMGSCQNNNNNNKNTNDSSIAIRRREMWVNGIDLFGLIEFDWKKW